MLETARILYFFFSLLLNRMRGKMSDRGFYSWDHMDLSFLSPPCLGTGTSRTSHKRKVTQGLNCGEWKGRKERKDLKMACCRYHLLNYLLGCCNGRVEYSSRYYNMVFSVMLLRYRTSSSRQLPHNFQLRFKRLKLATEGRKTSELTIFL